jgi:hypothetical protein
MMPTYPAQPQWRRPVLLMVLSVLMVLTVLTVEVNHPAQSPWPA